MDRAGVIWFVSMSSAPPPASSDDQVLTAPLERMLAAFGISQAIYVAAKLAVPDHLRDGAKSSDELATLTRTDPRSMHRLCRTLAVFMILTEEGDGRFALSPLGALLRSDHPAGMRGDAILNGEIGYPALGALLHTVQTGEPGFRRAFGMDLFEYLAGHPELAEHFNRQMARRARAHGAALLGAHDFSRATRVVDVGGGHGGLLSALLRAHPRLHGILFEREAVLAGARSRLEGDGVLARCELVGGDFFESIPPGGEVYLLGSVVHDWDDAQSLRILRNVRAVVPPEGTLLLVEALLPNRAQDAPGVVVMDANMMVLTGGMERSEAQHRALLSDAGFRLDAVHPTPTPSSVLVALPC